MRAHDDFHVFIFWLHELDAPLQVGPPDGGAAEHHKFSDHHEHDAALE